jgi:hypothetical protein
MVDNTFGVTAEINMFDGRQTSHPARMLAGAAVSI